MGSAYLIPITVMIPIYNSESFLEETIDSVICQTFSNFELLLLDDGSTDNSRNIISKYKDPRIRYIYCEHDFIGTLNKGLELAQGKYIALLDHDDLMVPKRLQIQYEYLESNPTIIACGGYMHSFGKHSEQLKAPLEYIKLMKEMILRSPMLNPTGFIRREAIIKNNIRYQRGYAFAADFKFWSDLVKVGKIINIPKILTLYRTSSKQTSIIYAKESLVGQLAIQHEMINYFLSLIDESNKFYSILDEKFIPGIIDFNKYSFFSPQRFFSFMYELISGLIRENAIMIESVVNKNLIKAGYLISYDYEYLEYSLPLIYKSADQIFLAIDKDRKTWTGNTFQIPETFFKWITEYDVDKKIYLYEDKFYIPDLSPFECETRERNLLAKKMGENGWHIQIDVDEYFLDFEGFVKFLHALDFDIPTTVYAQWVTIFKQTEDTVFYIDSNEEFPLATNSPVYKFARKTDTFKTVKTNHKLLHPSWGRSEDDLAIKLKNWGHHGDFDIEAYLEFWRTINKSNYRFISNFHPIDSEKWKKLEYICATNIPALIEKMMILFSV